MDPKRPGFIRYFYEYAIYRAIEIAPEWRNSKVADDVPPIDPLTASQGRAVRHRIGEILAAQGLDMDQPEAINVSTFMEATNEALAEAIPDYAPVFANPAKGSDSNAYKGIHRAFSALTGVGNTFAEYGARLPISPYDPRWAHRETVMSAGTQLLSISDESLRSLDVDYTELTDPTVEGLGNVDASWRMQLEYTQPQETSRDGEVGVAGPAYTSSDALGLSRLRTYMTEREYREAEPWLKGVATTTRGSAIALRDAGMSEGALDRSVSILNYLSDAGIDFSIQPDRNPGQLAAKITGTGISVRLTDTPGNEAFIGRVYDRGVVTTFSKGQVNSADRDMYVPTPSEVVDLVRYARGEQVARRDGAGLVGVVAQRQTRRGQVNESYHVKAGKGTASMHLYDASRDLYIRRSNNVSPNVRWFSNEDAAMTYLTDAVDTARENFATAIDLDGLLEEMEAFEGEEMSDFIPSAKGDSYVDALRQDYARLLGGSHDARAVFFPGFDEDTAREAFEQGIDPSEFVIDPSLAVDVESDIRRHMAAVIDDRVGTLEPDAQGLRFDPVVVSQFMTSQNGVWRNNDDIVAALRRTDITAEELKGSDFYNSTVGDRLITFDPETAVDTVTHEDPLVQNIGSTVSATLASRGAIVDSVQIDERGIVQWEARRAVKFNVKGEPEYESVTGQIGQIFPRGEYGEVTTKFAMSENHVAVPGWRAEVIPQGPGERKTLEERTRLRGYEQLLTEAVAYQVASDIVVARTEVGDPTSVNRVLRSLYDTKHPIDFIERMSEEGMSEGWRRAIIETEAARVRYNNDFGANSTMSAWHYANNTPDSDPRHLDPRNDNSRDPLVLSGNRNMSVIDMDASAGIFDPIMTGMATNQGIVRYLVNGATVNPDGSITPSEDPNARVAVAAHPDASKMGYNPHDRQNMSFSNIMHASSLVSGAHTAMTQLGGWTFEDGVVISKKFAEEHGVRGTDGQMRSLVVGDKLSDFHGNKGVVALVVDPYMDRTEAEALGIANEVEFFANNDVDVVMSPFSSISRYNGGTARELMENPRDLLVTDNAGNSRVVPGGCGDLNIIVTHMAVDAKTNIYDAEAMAAGKGRKASNQLAWALQSKKCEAIFRDFYGGNDTNIASVNEYLTVLGMKLDPLGTVRMASSVNGEEFGDERQVFAMPELEIDSRNNVVMKRMKEDFGMKISGAGGVMELPFPLTLASGEQTQPLGVDANGATTWGLPVLSAGLRNETDLVDGSVSRHDHTLRYLSVFEHATRYRHLSAQLAEAKEAGDTVKINELSEAMDKHVIGAQTSYEQISNDVIARRVEGKRNMFKERVMGHRLPHSATAVWTANPNLPLDCVAMNEATAKELDPQGKGYALVWRDPVLRDGGVRYMRIVKDNDLTGVAVNPVVVKSFDGDFDGDSVGLVGNLSAEAHTEALHTFSVPMNMIDRGVGVRDPETGEMSWPLGVHDSLDVKVAQHVTPGMKDMFDDHLARFNDVEHRLRRGEITVEQAFEENTSLTESMGGLYRDALANRDGVVTLQFTNVDDHLKSVARCYETGAKGNAGKVDGYSEYLGARRDETGTWVDTGQPTMDEMADKYAGSQCATAFKSQYTGVAGARSQAAVQLLRVHDQVGQACETGYPATQAMLQAKNDPIDAEYRAETLAGPIKSLWTGRRMVHGYNDEGRYTWQEAEYNGKPVQATRDEFVEQFQRMYCDDAGMGVPVGIDHIEAVADALTDENGRIRDTSRSNWSEWDKQNRPLPLDRMAYGGSMAELVELAQNEENLFEGINSCFMTDTIRKNVALVDKQLADIQRGVEATADLTHVRARDVQATATPRQQTSPLAASRSFSVVPLDRKSHVGSPSHSRDNEHDMAL